MTPHKSLEVRLVYIDFRIKCFFLYICTELTESSSLLVLTLEVMKGYQKLSPTIFAQVDFNVAKLLSPLCRVDRTDQCDPEVVIPTLQLLLDAPPDSLKWQQQVLYYEYLRASVYVYIYVARFKKAHRPNYVSVCFYNLSWQGGIYVHVTGHHCDMNML